jgi:hypothetical protein
MKRRLFSFPWRTAGEPLAMARPRLPTVLLGAFGALGLVLGALMLTRLMSGVLYGAKAIDPLTFVGTGTILLAD